MKLFTTSGRKQSVSLLQRTKQEWNPSSAPWRILTSLRQSVSDILLTLLTGSQPHLGRQNSFLSPLKQQRMRLPWSALISQSQPEAITIVIHGRVREKQTKLIFKVVSMILTNKPLMKTDWLLGLSEYNMIISYVKPIYVNFLLLEAKNIPHNSISNTLDYMTLNLPIVILILAIRV